MNFREFIAFLVSTSIVLCSLGMGAESTYLRQDAQMNANENVENGQESRQHASPSSEAALLTPGGGNSFPTIFLHSRLPPPQYLSNINNNNYRRSLYGDMDEEEGGVDSGNSLLQPMKRAQTFVRFGKRAQTFVRFGKRTQTFVRFGK